LPAAHNPIDTPSLSFSARVVASPLSGDNASAFAKETALLGSNFSAPPNQIKRLGLQFYDQNHRFLIRIVGKVLA